MIAKTTNENMAKIQRQITTTKKINALLLLIKSRQRYLGEHVPLGFNDAEVHQQCGINENEVRWLLEQFSNKGYVRLLGNMRGGETIEITLDGELHIEALKDEPFND